MQICRFFVPQTGVRLGAVLDEKVYDLTASAEKSLQSVVDFLLHTVEFSDQQRVSFLAAQLKSGKLPSYLLADLDRPPAPGVAYMMAPIDQQEVWASGVTYLISRDAREEESNRSNIYNRVYDAERPDIGLNRYVAPFIVYIESIE